ncbi:MAG: hypothetical protein ABIH39_05540 [Candidatus Margulisiibacteriota bacterium]
MGHIIFEYLFEKILGIGREYKNYSFDYENVSYSCHQLGELFSDMTSLAYGQEDFFGQLEEILNYDKSIAGYTFSGLIINCVYEDTMRELGISKQNGQYIMNPREIAGYKDIFITSAENKVFGIVSAVINAINNIPK